MEADLEPSLHSRNIKVMHNSIGKYTGISPICSVYNHNTAAVHWGHTKGDSIHTGLYMCWLSYVVMHSISDLTV